MTFQFFEKIRNQRTNKSLHYFELCPPTITISRHDHLKNIYRELGCLAQLAFKQSMRGQLGGTLFPQANNLEVSLMSWMFTA